MKNVIGKVLMTSAVLASMVVPAISASADDTANLTGSTNASATFTPGTTTVNPVDPTDPTKPGTDKNNGAKPGSGLSLIYVTNGLDFGSHQVDVVNKNDYDASTSKTLWNGKAVVQVADSRGTNAGWNLSVAADQFATTSGDKLTGATLTLPGAASQITTNTGISNGVTSSALSGYALDNSIRNCYECH
ncbi:WxL domain-containing protein [Furfurilactobacillus entadae]|uniref:WxL domain-containing protein n=1 Tax=Furfurilactobacillus entadae TaxID=2922307 RepID=UPI0035E51F3A